MEDELKSRSIEITRRTAINEARKASTKAPKTRENLEPTRTTTSRVNRSVTLYPMTAAPPTANQEKQGNQEEVREKVKISMKVTLKRQTRLILS